MGAVSAPLAPPVALVHGFTSSFSRNWEQTGWVEILREMGREVIGAVLLAVAAAQPERVRRLVVGGLGENVLRGGDSEPLAGALPDARLKVLRGVDHLGLAGAMGFIEAALGFLE